MPSITYATARRIAPSHPNAEALAYAQFLEREAYAAIREALRFAGEARIKLTTDAEEVPIEERLGKTLTPLFKSISKRNRAAWGKVLKVPIPPPADAFFEGWNRENVSLITSLTEEAAARALDTIQAATRKGLSYRDLTKEIQRALDVSKSRARLIARDQTLKINGQITESCHAAAGIDGFVWVTSNDERVRPSHAERNGQRYKYAAPPGGVIPGYEFQCRCIAYPDVHIPGLPRLR